RSRHHVLGFLSRALAWMDAAPRAQNSRRSPLSSVLGFLDVVRCACHAFSNFSSLDRSARSQFWIPSGCTECVLVIRSFFHPFGALARRSPVSCRRTGRFFHVFGFFPVVRTFMLLEQLA